MFRIEIRKRFFHTFITKFQDDLLTFGGGLDGGSVVGGGGADCDTHSVAASSTHTHMTSASSMAARYNSGVTGSLTASSASVSGAARERALHIASAHVVKAAGQLQALPSLSGLVTNSILFC